MLDLLHGVRDTERTEGVERKAQNLN